MTIIIKTIILTVISFVATNIDDLVIDTFFFTEIKNKKDIKIVVLGKYLGLGFLVLVSIIASFGLNFILFAYIRYLGFIPLYLGIKEIIHNKDDEEVKVKQSSNLMSNVILITGLSAAVIRFAPIDIDNKQFASVHGENENISVDRLSLTVEFYKKLLKNYK